MRKDYIRDDWSIHDRANSTILNDVNGKKGESLPYCGIMIGDRQIMGVKDIYVVPTILGLVVMALGFAFISFFLTTDEATGVSTLSWSFFAFEAIFVILGIVVLVHELKDTRGCKKFNEEQGMAAIWVNPEERTLAVKDIRGSDLLLRFDQITKFWRLATLNITISGVGIVIFPRLFIHYLDDDGKKRIKIVHFLDNPNYVVHVVEMLRHEYRGAPLSAEKKVEASSAETHNSDD